jgi:hypothetical protein
MKCTILCRNKTHLVSKTNLSKDHFCLFFVLLHFHLRLTKDIILYHYHCLNIAHSRLELHIDVFAFTVNPSVRLHLTSF